MAALALVVSEEGAKLKEGNATNKPSFIAAPIVKGQNMRCVSGFAPADAATARRRICDRRPRDADIVDPPAAPQDKDADRDRGDAITIAVASRL